MLSAPEPPLSPAPEEDAPPIILAEGLCKSFSGVRVLEDVDFTLRAGEVHAVIGENGAGKSTLLKILAGVHRPDAGRIVLQGLDVQIGSPHAAGALGISLIHQEPQGFPDLSIAENVFLGHALPRGRLGHIDWRRMRDETRRLLGSLGVELDPRAKLRGLSIADQQLVEMAAALSQKARVLLMDEPTASLTPREVERLFGIIRRLRGEGTAIVFISHRLPEVFEIADRITVLRDGRLIRMHQAAETNPEQIIQEMVGRPLSALYERPGATGRTHSDAGDPCSAGRSLLEVEGLCGARFRNVSFSVRAGEIVGMAGLVGAGRTEVAQGIFGVTRAHSGSIRVNGQPVSIRSPRDAIRHGIAYVPEDRQQHGLLLPMSVAANTSAARLERVSRLGWLSGARERQLAGEWANRLQTRLRSLAQPAKELSGGNQQKVVLAKWLNTQPRVLILDEPTRGIDVGAKAEVHRLMAELARQGKAILMISSDLPEVLAMSDRVLVMREGRLTGEFARGEATQEAVMRAATGQSASAEEPVRSTGVPPVPALAPHQRRPEFPLAPGSLGTGGTPVLRADPAARGWWQWWSRFRELGIAAVVVLAFALCAAVEPRFLSTENLRNILLYIPLIVVVAMGQMMVIVSRNIDLSVGSMLGFAAILAGNLFIDYPAMPVWLAALLAAGVGGLLGLVNGVLVCGYVTFLIIGILSATGTHTILHMFAPDMAALVSVPCATLAGILVGFLTEIGSRPRLAWLVAAVLSGAAVHSAIRQFAPGASPAIGPTAGLAAAVFVAFVGRLAGGARAPIPAIIATLGTLTAYRGLVFIYSGGRQVDNNDLPVELIRLSQSSPIRIPWIVLFALAVALATAAWLRYTRTGREIFAIGSNPHAAELRGIAVRRVLLLVFTLTGVLSGIAGLMWASRFGTVNPRDAGAAFELIVISAVVIGGVNVFGGSGTVLGVFLGCLLLGLVNVALPTLGISAFWQLALYGLAILLAATIDTLIHRGAARGEVAT